MGQTVQLLENALRAWEDLFLINEAKLRVGIDADTRRPEELVGPVRHWRELRNHLLALKGGDFDVNRFCQRDTKTKLLRETGRRLFNEEELVAGRSPTHTLYESLPLQLASWSISSRRVFHVSDDMVKRFLAADYSKYVWSDLLWPFDSFFIRFETDIKTSTGAHAQLGGLLVSSVYGVCPQYALSSEEGFECLMFAPALEGEPLPEELLTAKERERLEADIRHKRWDKLSRRVHNAVRNLLDDDGKGGPPAGFGKPVCWEKGESVQSGSMGPLFGKIIAGLCLYLEALPAGVVENYGWRQTLPQKLPRDVRKIITDGELVCQVEDFNVLSPDTITLFPETLKQGPAYAVTPHWRRAHYRRARGQGNNPNAPRDILVKPTLIHKDQLPEGAVPGGSMSSVR